MKFGGNIIDLCELTKIEEERERGSGVEGKECKERRPKTEKKKERVINKGKEQGRHRENG